MKKKHSNFGKLWDLTKEYSLLLILMSLFAVLLANTNYEIYDKIVNFSIWKDAPFGHFHNGHYDLTFGFIVNEILMTFFFAVAGKEVWEAIILKNGSLRGRQAFSTGISTIGGVIGPVVIYFLISYFLGKFEELQHGWAIPTATDIAFAYLVGRIIYGKNHPALNFLMALAILDDAIGLVILAIFYPSGELELYWLLLSLFTAGFMYFFFNFFVRKFGDKYIKYTIAVKKLGLFPYCIAGIFSWISFYKAGVHPVLSLIPIIVVMPHKETYFGIFKLDLLNKFEHKLENYIPWILGLFGFINSGILFTSINEATWSVLVALLIGKPLGIFLFGLLSKKLFGLPNGMHERDLLILGCIAGIGFTVSLFVSIQAFPAGFIQDGAKMGALLSFLAIPIALIISKVLKKF